MNKLFKKVESTRLRYEKACEELETEARKVCDFNMRITWCAGDGHLVLNEETSGVAQLNCLNGRTEDDKLTEDDHLKYCI